MFDGVLKLEVKFYLGKVFKMVGMSKNKLKFSQESNIRNLYNLY